jgi:multicomponent Na+:H+ antiporter subunit E
VNGFFLNVMLSLLWAAMSANFSFENLVFGFALGFVILFFTRRVVGAPRYGAKVRYTISLALYFLWELIVANLRVAFDVVTPRHLMRPGIIAVPLDARSDVEITLLANMIGLTPGTLSLDVSHDRTVLYVHTMYDGDDVEGFRRKIKQGFERRILEVLR